MDLECLDSRGLGFEFDFQDKHHIKAFESYIQHSTCTPFLSLPTSTSSIDFPLG